jgi:hypothetical protein
MSVFNIKMRHPILFLRHLHAFNVYEIETCSIDSGVEWPDRVASLISYSAVNWC